MSEYLLVMIEIKRFFDDAIRSEQFCSVSEPVRLLFLDIFKGQNRTRTIGKYQILFWNIIRLKSGLYVFEAGLTTDPK